MQIKVSLCFYTHLFSLMSTVAQEKKWCHFNVGGICGPKRINRGNCLILFLTVLFIGKEWLSLLILLKTGLLKLFRFEKLLKIAGNALQ